MPEDSHDMKELDESLRKADNSFDLEALGALKFDRLVELYQYLNDEANALFGSDQVDVNMSALAESMLAEARLLKALMDVEIERLSYRHAVAGSALHNMRLAAGYVRPGR